MSVYFNKRREWWEYYFRHNKTPYTGAGFKRKKHALEAEADRKKEVKQPQPVSREKIDMGFLTLLNESLDYLQAYRSKKHYQDTLYMAKKWVNQWKERGVHEISPEMIRSYLISVRQEVSAHTANKELRCLRALFNYGIKPPNRWFVFNPTDGLEFFPTESKVKYIPPVEDVIKVILAAEGGVQDYLWTIALTLGRMSEVNRLEWKDIDFHNRTVTLYTRNKGEWVTGPYQDRKKIMKSLCERAGVRYFRFHPIRHFGASLLEKEGVSIKVIQELLGHENRRTTEIYLHSFAGSEKEAMDRLNMTLSMFNSGFENEKRKTETQD